MRIPTYLLNSLKTVSGLGLWANAPLAPFTTLGVGGRATMLVSVSTPQAAAETLALLVESQVNWTVIGSGSNLLVADRGYPGVVVKLNESFHYVEGPYCLSRDWGKCQNALMVVGAGVPLPRVAAFVADNNLSGLEFVCGIPGSLGGGIAMNAGAHGSSLSDVVSAVEVAGPAGVEWLDARNLEWGYRHCALPASAIVTAARVQLQHSDRTAVLARHRSLLRARRQSQPRGVHTFGSAFKNPPEHSAGRLLESSGMKGVRRGAARVSPVHANFITNLGDATAADVLSLMLMMRDAVWRRHGLLLEPEVRLLGAEFPWVAETLDVSGPANP